MTLKGKVLEVELDTNVYKIKILTQTRSNRTDRQNTITDNTVNKFQCLGTIIIYKTEEKQEIQQIIYKAFKTYFASLPIIRSKNVHQRTELKLHKKIPPALCYGRATWTLTRNLRIY
jgi:hypothetical protein